MNSFEIQLKKGYGDLHFGMSPEEVIPILGTPDEIENLEIDDDNVTIITQYDKFAIALFFVNAQKPYLECIETSNINTLLFGEKIFLLKEDEIIKLMKENGINNYETEPELWGEKRLTFEDVMIDFYFEKSKLSVISWGILIDENGKL